MAARGCLQARQAPICPSTRQAQRPEVSGGASLSPARSGSASMVAQPGGLSSTPGTAGSGGGQFAFQHLIHAARPRAALPAPAGAASISQQRFRLPVADVTADPAWSRRLGVWYDDAL